MRDTFAAIVPWATLVYAVSSMLAVGLGSTIEAIVGPLRYWPRVIRALAANFLLAPALAYLLGRFLQLNQPLAILFLVGSAAGAPFLIKLIQAARGDLAFAGSILVLLLPLTVVFLPLVLPTVLPRAEVSAAAIAQPLIFSMLLPLAVGLALRPVAPDFAARSQHALGRISTVALVVLLVSVIIGDWEALTFLGWRDVMALFAFTLSAYGLGLALGGRYRSNRTVISLATAQRNIAAATVVATQTFGGQPGVVVMVTGTAVVGMAVLFPIAFAIRRGAERAESTGRLRRRHA